MRRWLLFTVLVSCLSDITAAGTVEAVYPAREWATKSADEVGLDTGKLEAFSDYAGGLGCVVRHGYMAYTWGDASRRMDIASAVKPLYAHFLFKALQDGRIANLDEPVCQLRSKQ